jgi:hypothetical protein
MADFLTGDFWLAHHPSLREELDLQSLFRQRARPVRAPLESGREENRTAASGRTHRFR